MLDPRTRPRRRWLPTTNMPTWERVARIFGGLLLVATVLSGAGLLASLDGTVRLVVAVVLTLGAGDLILSGAVGWCPVYRYVRMPWTPRPPG